jgi:hypothetical protein
MSCIREMIFGPDLHFTKPLVRRVFIVMLAITLLFAAWHYGIIASAALVLRTVAIGTWDILCDLAAAGGDFLRYIDSQRSH